jgi:hypothetical protein
VNKTKVKDLLTEIQSCQTKYGDEFLEWDVYTEQINSYDKKAKKGKGFGGNWKFLKDSEGWEYIECAGFWTKFEKEKAFTINVNY